MDQPIDLGEFTKELEELLKDRIFNSGKLCSLEEDFTDVIYYSSHTAECRYETMYKAESCIRKRCAMAEKTLTNCIQSGIFIPWDSDLGYDARAVSTVLLGGSLIGSHAMRQNLLRGCGWQLEYYGSVQFCGRKRNVTGILL